MPSKEAGLRYYLYLFGILNIFVVSSVPILLGDFLLWSPRNIPTELMLSSVCQRGNVRDDAHYG
jgi:hypothetical protein